MKKHAGLIGLTLLLPLLLSACTAGGGGGDLKVTDDHRGLPTPQASGPVQSFYTDGPSAYWTDTDKRSITLLTFGSGSCPVVPTAAKVDSAAKLTLTMKHYDGACTADLGPHTTVFDTPSGLDKAKTITITLRANNGNQTDSSVKLRPNVTVRDPYGIKVGVGSNSPAPVVSVN